MAGTTGDMRDYHFTDGELVLFVDALSNAITRDLSQFGSYGVSSLSVDNLIDLSDAFQNLPSDELVRTDLSYAVEQKTDKMNIVLSTMRSISVRAKAVFGENSAKYRAMSPGNISQMSDSQLLLAAGQVHDAAATNQAALAAEGVTVLYLSDFQTAIQDYEDAINEVANRKMVRDDSTENRIIKGNELYGYVNKYCDYGKAIWDGVSEAKKNDYVMYGAAPVVVPGKIQNLAYNSATAKFTWQADSNATSYQIETSPDGSEWLQIYEGASAEYINTQGPGTGIARCRGVNDNGNGSWSDNLDYTVPVPVPNIVSVGFDGGNNRSIVTFNTVAYADLYLIYQSVVPIGNPAGAFDEIGTPTSSPFYTVSANNAMREYYYVKASYNDVLSVQSNIVYLDVPVA